MEALMLLFTFGQLGFSVGMFANWLPRREFFWWRTLGVLGIIVALLFVLWIVGTGEVVGALLAARPLLRNFVVFTGVFLLAVGAVAFLFEGPRWGALFCATMGYTVQNLWNAVYRLVTMGLLPENQWSTATQEHLSLQLATTIVVYAACYWAFAKRSRDEQLVFAGDWKLLVTAALVLVVCIGFSSSVDALLDYGLPLDLLVFFAVIHIVVDLLLLSYELTMVFSRRISQQMAATEKILESERKQFELSQENVQAINVKAHDLRHQIRELRNGERVTTPEVLDDVEAEVDLFESFFQTGNEALDVILSEKTRQALAQGSMLEVMAEGEALSFMAPADVYSLFGNALDNALEAVAKVPAHEDRIVTLKVRGLGSMVTVLVENPYVGEVAFSDGLPRTSKDDTNAHGFGSLSMKLLCERYGGSLAISAEDGLYSLSMVLPQP